MHMHIYNVYIWLARLRRDIRRAVSIPECAEPDVNYPWESLHQHLLIIIIYDFTCINFNSIKHSFFCPFYLQMSFEFANTFS